MSGHIKDLGDNDSEVLEDCVPGSHHVILHMVVTSLMYCF